MVIGMCAIEPLQKIKETIAVFWQLWHLIPSPCQYFYCCLTGVAPSFSSFYEGLLLYMMVFDQVSALVLVPLLFQLLGHTRLITSLRLFLLLFLFWYSCIKFPHWLVFFLFAFFLFLQPWYSGWIVKKYKNKKMWVLEDYFDKLICRLEDNERVLCGGWFVKTEKQTTTSWRKRAKKIVINILHQFVSHVYHFVECKI